MGVCVLAGAVGVLVAVDVRVDRGKVVGLAVAVRILHREPRVAWAEEHGDLLLETPFGSSRRRDNPRRDPFAGRGRPFDVGQDLGEDRQGRLALEGLLR